MNQSREERKFILLICLLLTVVTLAVFWQLKDHEFINYDDPSYVTENPHVQTGFTRQNIAWAFTTYHTGNWHPLTWLSHMLDCRLAGLQAAWHHMTSLFLHIASTLLLFLVFWQMTKALWQSAFVAALFALHPLHVESVAWVAERKDVLSTLFWMLTMAAYVYYVKQRELRRYILLLVFFVLGLMAKPMLVTLPFVLLLLDYWPLGRLQRMKLTVPNHALPRGQKKPNPKKRQAVRDNVEDCVQIKQPISLLEWPVIGALVREKLPLFAFSAIASVITYYHQQEDGAMMSLHDLPLIVRMGNALVSYTTYLGKLIWPVNLAVFYPYTAVLSPVHVLGAALVLLLITLFVIGAAKRCPYLPVGWFWFLGTLVPVIGLVQVGMQAMADRYTYIPFVGLFVITAWGVPELAMKWPYKRALLAAAAGVILLSFLIVTHAQLKYWQNSLTLFRHALSVTSNNGVAHNNLGIALRGTGMLDEAEYHYREALKIKSDNEQAHFNLGNLLLAKGKTDEAIFHYSEALRIKPAYIKAHINMGVALARQNRLPEAVDHYKKAIALNAADAGTYYNLGQVLFAMGRPEEAAAQFREAIFIRPGFAEAYNELGRILGGSGKTEEAIGCFKKAVMLKPDFTAARINLKIALSLYNKQ